MGEEVKDGWEIKDKQAGRPAFWRLGWHKGPPRLRDSEGEVSPPYTGALRGLLRRAASMGEAKAVREAMAQHRGELAAWWDAQDDEVQALLVAVMSEQDEPSEAWVRPVVR